MFPLLRDDRRSCWLATLAAIALSLALIPTTAFAQGSGGGPPKAGGNAPWVQDAQELRLNGIHDHAQLTDALHRIERSSDGRMTLESVGTSNEGRDLWLASVGTGERKLLYITQQHGDEVHGTEAAVHALRTLAQSNDPEVRHLREEVTLLVMPMLNPDGAERAASHGWRENYDPECDPALDGCRLGRGYDLNRWHDPRLTNDEVPAPEAVAMREVYQLHQPELIIDYHNQISYVTDDGDHITTSVQWPTLPASVEMTPERDAAVDYGKQVSRLIYDTLQGYGHAEVTLFPGGTGLNIARNAYGYLGTGVVLVESRGQATDIGQKALGTLVRQLYVTMLDIVQGVADGSVFEIDPALADEIPERGTPVGNPNAGKPGERCPAHRSTQTGDVVEVDASLYQVVLDYRSQILATGSEAYVRPSKEEACTLFSAFEHLAADEPELAAGLIDPLDYDVLRIADEVTGRTLLALAERPTATLDEQRGWGLYVHDPASTSNVTLQVPNPRGVANSETLAAQAFDTYAAKTLMIHGSRNGANQADDLHIQPANPRENPDSVFHHVHLAAVERGDIAIQAVGTGVGNDREVVVTAGEVPPSPFAEAVGVALEAADFEVCLFGDGECTRFHNVRNVQGQAARASGADWVALYPHASIRGSLTGRQELVDALANALP